GYTKKEKKFGGETFSDLDKQDIRAIENPKFKDSTGCGDVFAASFTYEFSKHRDFSKSLYFANRMSSFKTSLEGIDELYKLK
ncbi:MAG TPA: PfkB family carbohydrate kinase, partial [Ignavibacteria bacterium]|nr:PfkB family carbohydrate kinase [Ignavibacteria bacterium]